MSAVTQCNGCMALHDISGAKPAEYGWVQIGMRDVVLDLCKTCWERASAAIWPPASPAETKGEGT